MSMYGTNVFINIGSGDPWEWRPLGVATPVSGDPCEWGPLGVVDPGSGDPWERRLLGVADPNQINLSILDYSQLWAKSCLITTFVIANRANSRREFYIFYVYSSISSIRHPPALTLKLKISSLQVLLP